MRRPPAVCLVVVLLGAFAVPLGPAGGAVRGPGALAMPQEFDRTEFGIRVYPNGSARWTFAYKRTLENDTQVREFEAFAERFNGNETELYANFKRRARALVRAGSNATGREMHATAFDRRAYVTNLENQGIVEMSFLWTNFATVEDGTVIVGDVFDGGLYVGPNQRLSIRWGEELRLRVVAPPAESRTDDSVTWTGGEDGRAFLDDRPWVEFVVAEGNSTAGTTNPARPTGGTIAATASPMIATTTVTTPAGPVGSGLSPIWLVGLVVLMLGLGAAFAWRSGGLSPLGHLGDGGDGAAAAEPAVFEEELLTDEDRVMRLLEENGGRMKQVHIVEGTEWSKSKVSMLLSEMEDEGLITKLRVGRENIISLEGHEPEAASSPFDDRE